MPNEPAEKRTIAFIDGQNLFHSARETFGHTHPNYDVKALAETVCNVKGWKLQQVRFYTGIPDSRDNAPWNKFWAAKLLAMSRSGVHTFTRKLRYRNKPVLLPDRHEFGDMAGKEYAVLTGEEKGIDVRISLDVIRMAHRKEFDIALVFSQDQDLSESLTKSASLPANRTAGFGSLPPTLQVRHLATLAESTRPTG